MTSPAVVVMTTTEAEWVTNRIRNAVSTLRVGFDELESAVVAAKTGCAHIALGYQSWTAYLSDVLGREPLRLDATERRELVAYLSGQGMSARAIAPIVSVDHATVARDVRVSHRATPAPVAVDAETGEITELSSTPEPPRVTGLDGKTYTRPTTSPRVPERRINVAASVSAALVQIDTGRRALESLTAAQLRTQDEEARSRWAANLSEQIDALAGVLARLNKETN
jgi:hypothetical protein